jgi:fibronectin type 3 domain-containing protein
MPSSKFLVEVFKMLARNRITVILSMVVVSGLIAWIACCGGSSAVTSSTGGSPTPTPAPASHSATLSWQPSTSPGAAFYNVYRSTISGGPYTRVGWRVSGSTFTDTTVQPGSTYFYVVTSVTTSNVESAVSGQITASVPSP